MGTGMKWKLNWINRVPGINREPIHWINMVLEKNREISTLDEAYLGKNRESRLDK